MILPSNLGCLSAAVAAVLLSSCGTARFYAQAVRGQLEILQKARPISSVEAKIETDAVLREKLKLVTELRNFARMELRLPVKKQFSTYADLGRPYAVICVYAAPEFSTDGKTWWYPFVGHAKYRGFFDEKLAKEEAGQLKRDGFDIYAGGVRVYSTLGWFADPVLNTFINEDPAEVAETIFHELTHSRVFIRGDSDFNEAFATANAQEGVRRWLRSKGDAAALARYEKGLGRDEKILLLLKKTRDHLAKLYEGKDTMPAEEMRRAKARQLDAARQEYAAMKMRGEADGVRDPWFGKHLNNARLASIATYRDLVPGFARLLRENDGNLEKYYRAVEAMQSMDKVRRREVLAPQTKQGTSAAPARS